MFTGIIEELGVVKQIERQKAVRLTVLAKAVLEQMKIGDSLAVNGVCLTVGGFSSSEIMVDISPETLGVTGLGILKVGDGVNLERAMRLDDRLGGHLVTGHVDGVGKVRDRRQEGEYTVLRIEAAAGILRYCVKKGSIAVDGVSLTLNDLSDKDFTVMIIPHTAKMTTLGLKGAGDPVNLETDLIGKYVERLLCGDEAGRAAPKIDLEYLRKHNLL